MATSEVPRSEATPLASTRPVRTTLRGSRIPASIMSTYSPLALSKPLLKSPANSSMSLPTTTAPSRPAFFTMDLAGCVMAFLTMLTPSCWSKLSGLMDSWAAALRSAVPPPGRMPSSTAARVALRASTKRSFFSPTSTSEVPPTLMTATPPESLARRSWSFSFSYSDVAASAMTPRICSQRWLIMSLVPSPLRTMVSSLVMVMEPVDPSMSGVAFSSLMSSSSVKTVALVRTAMSPRMDLRLSPKPGALTAATCSWPRSLLRMHTARASPSMSSAMMTRGRRSWVEASRAGMMSWTAEIFFSESRIRGFSNSTFCDLVSVMK